MAIDVRVDNAERRSASAKDTDGLDRAVSEIPRLLVQAERGKRTRRRMKRVAALAVLVLLLATGGVVAWRAGWIGPFELPRLDTLWEAFRADS
jgi:hypothetical protein